MKKWSEIEKSILGKLFMDEREAKNQGYYDKFLILANECLNEIANGVMPKVNEFKPITYKVLTKPYVSNKVYIDSLLSGDWTISGDVSYTLNQEDGCVELLEPLKNNEHVDIIRSNYAEDNVYKLKLTASTDNECVLTINDLSGTYHVVKMPDNFLSFSDMINYFESIEDPKIVYISNRKIMLKENGEYKFTPDGSSVLIIPGKESECNEKLIELRNLDIPITNITFSIDELDGLDVSIS